MFEEGGPIHHRCMAVKNQIPRWGNPLGNDTQALTFLPWFPTTGAPPTSEGGGRGLSAARILAIRRRRGGGSIGRGV